MKRIAIPSGIALLLSSVAVAPVAAAAPTNDTYATRTVVSGVPYTATVDTTEATTDADDVAINAACGAPATDASVWYELTPAADASLVADTSGSTYSAGVLVATGTPGAWVIETCGPGAVAWSATAGTTYTILVFDDQLDGSGNGGTLNFGIVEAPPPPEIDITVDPVAAFDSRSGSVTLTGTITCTTGATVDLAANLRQAVGRFTVSGFGHLVHECDGTEQAWSMDVIGETGQFRGGRATALVSGFTCAPECTEDFVEATVRLRS